MNTTGQLAPPISETIAAYEEVLSFLRDPATFGVCPDAFKEIETHISHIFLTGKLAYKLKKPVKLDFLDFSSAANRRAACEAEVRLNRRFASRVYRATVRIVRGDRGLELASANEDRQAVDYLVVMRQLDETFTLESVVEQSPLPLRKIESALSFVVDKLVQQAPACVVVDRFISAWRTRLQSNLQTLEVQSLAADGPDRSTVLSLAKSQLASFERLAEEIKTRARDGRVICGHGDLRPEHVYLTKPPCVIDCIEFAKEYRVLDVVDDLAFLAMELDLNKQTHLSVLLLKIYSDTTGDDYSEELLRFYMSYRASTRAKVCMLQPDRTAVRRASGYMKAAINYLLPQI